MFEPHGRSSFFFFSKHRKKNALFASPIVFPAPQDRPMCLADSETYKTTRACIIFPDIAKLLINTAASFIHFSLTVGCTPIRKFHLPREFPALPDPASIPFKQRQARFHAPPGPQPCQNLSPSHGWMNEFAKADSSGYFHPKTKLKGSTHKRLKLKRHVISNDSFVSSLSEGADVREGGPA